MQPSASERTNAALHRPNDPYATSLFATERTNERTNERTTCTAQARSRTKNQQTRRHCFRLASCSPPLLAGMHAVGHRAGRLQEGRPISVLVFITVLEHIRKGALYSRRAIQFSYRNLLRISSKHRRIYCQQVMIMLVICGMVAAG